MVHEDKSLSLHEEFFLLFYSDIWPSYLRVLTSLRLVWAIGAKSYEKSSFSGLIFSITRTQDLTMLSQALYRLSYPAIPLFWRVEHKMICRELGLQSLAFHGSHRTEWILGANHGIEPARTHSNSLGAHPVVRTQWQCAPSGSHSIAVRTQWFALSGGAHPVVRTQWRCAP